MDIQIDTIIKSLDFPGNQDNYMIGRVEKIEHGRIHCKTLKMVVQGETREPATGQLEFSTDEMGEGMLDHVWTDRIQVIEGDQEWETA